MGERAGRVKTDPPCDCIKSVQGRWGVDCCDCQNTGDIIHVASWCWAMNARIDLRKNYRNIWCILRSIDMHEVEFSDPARVEEWKAYRWAEFRDDPHSYFLRCEDVVADAIWEAVENRL